MTHTHIFFYLFTCQWILCPFASSSFVFCHWVVRVLYTFWITHHYQIRDLQMFSPFLWVVFSPYWWCPLKDMKYCRGKGFKLKLFKSGPGRSPHGEAEFWKKDLKGGGGTGICCKSKRKQQVQRPWGRSLPDGLEGQKKANMFGAQQVRGKIVTQLAFPLKREPWGLKQRKDRQGLSYTSKESLLLLPRKRGVSWLEAERPVRGLLEQSRWNTMAVWTRVGEMLEDEQCSSLDILWRQNQPHIECKASPYSHPLGFRDVLLTVHGLPLKGPDLFSLYCQLAHSSWKKSPLFFGGGGHIHCIPSTLLLWTCVFWVLVGFCC